MGHTPYGYSIENGCATIKEDEANKIRKLYENYLSGMALAKAAAAAWQAEQEKERGVCSFSYRLSHGSGRATL